jgi:hypothetical protein
LTAKVVHFLFGQKQNRQKGKREMKGPSSSLLPQNSGHKNVCNDQLEKLVHPSSANFRNEDFEASVDELLHKKNLIKNEAEAT